MNFTGDYNDHLEGKYLACMPGNEAAGLEFACTLVIPVVALVMLATGLWFLQLVYIQRRYRKSIARQTGNTVLMPAGQTSPKVSSNNGSTRASGDVENDVFSYIEKLILSMGVGTVDLALMGLVYGYGTMYPRTHIRGQIGDALSIFFFASTWYMSLLGHRGAIYFKDLIPKPGGAIHPTVISTEPKCQIPSITAVLDAMQSWLAPIIALGFWGLLHAGVYSRGWYLFIMMSSYALCGLRTFVAIVSQRMATLRRVVDMVNANNSGTREDQNRRRGFLTGKTSSLAIDLFAVFCNSVLSPASLAVSGSPFNSRQMAIHMLVVSVLFVVAQTMANVHLHAKFRKSRKKAGVTPKMRAQATSSVMPSDWHSHSTGSSAVNQSEI